MRKIILGVRPLALFAGRFRQLQSHRLHPTQFSPRPGLLAKILPFSLPTTLNESQQARSAPSLTRAALTDAAVWDILRLNGLLETEFFIMKSVSLAVCALLIFTQWLVGFFMRFGKSMFSKGIDGFQRELPHSISFVEIGQRRTFSKPTFTPKIALKWENWQGEDVLKRRRGANLPFKTSLSELGNKISLIFI